MAAKIILKKSSTPTSQPGTSDLEYGFSIKDALDVWDQEDKAAFIQLLGFHTYSEDL